MKQLFCITLLSLTLASATLACDYPGPPPGSNDVEASGKGIIWAGFSDATERYDHGVLGDSIEAGGLRVMTIDKGPCELAVLLPEDSVFEDIAPRIADINGDGRNDVVVIETHLQKGASLAVYSVVGDKLKKIAATPYIGASHRWLAPIGIADFNTDGYVDIAYVETPHIGGTLRIWTMRRGSKLREIAQVRGLSNHRIGDAFISGGVRQCDGKRPVMITAGNSWRRVFGVELNHGRPVVEEIGPYEGPQSFEEALTCR